MFRRQISDRKSAYIRHFPLLVLVLGGASVLLSQSSIFHESFRTPGSKLDAKWTTELGPSSFLGRTQLADWITPTGVGRFVVGSEGARLSLNTFNPTGFSFYGTHAKTISSFQPGLRDTVVLNAGIKLTSLQPGLVYALYFYGCPATGSCASQHDEIDIELVTNYLQPGGPPMVQLNRYANEPLGAGNGELVRLPEGFDPLVWHDWTIRWSRTRIEYLLDGTLLSTASTHVPQGPMQVNVIAWAPSSDWPAAFSPSLQPTQIPSQNQEFTALVKSVSVITAGPVDAANLNGTFTISSNYGGEFTVGDRWVVQLTGGPPDTPFAICATKDYDPVVCTPNFDRTNLSGNWNRAGNFGPEAVGDWTEWLQFPSGAVSNRISFTVGKTITGNFRLNNGLGGTFSAGQAWTLSLAGAPLGTSFDLCSEIAGLTVVCTPVFGLTDSNGSWKLTGVFSESTAGGWTLWLRFPSGDSNRVALIVVRK